MPDRTPIEGLEWILEDDRFGFGVGWHDHPEDNPEDEYEQAGLYIERAIARMKEQERIIKQYQKADGFLFAHGWKWENYIDTREEEYQVRLGKDVAEVLNHPIEVGEDGLPY